MTKKEIEAIKIFAAIGGRSKSKKKAESCRKNGQLGGRPKGSKNKKSVDALKKVI